MTRKVVLVESPYANNPESLRYLACCLLDSILRGEAPIASHALYPLALPEHCKAYDGKTGREIGLECRDALSNLGICSFDGKYEDDYEQITVVGYYDMGESHGMRIEENPIEVVRMLSGRALEVWLSGDWPTMAKLTHNHTIERQLV
jgi:hypothetical protein